MPYIVKYCRGSQAKATSEAGSPVEIPYDVDAWALALNDGATTQRSAAFVFDTLSEAREAARANGGRKSEVIEVLGPVEGLAQGSAEKVVERFQPSKGRS